MSLLLVLLLIGVCLPAAGAARATDEADGSGLRSVPEQVWEADFQGAISGELDAALQLRLAEASEFLLGKVPAISLAVALPGEGIWIDHRGVSNTETGASVSADDLFQVASISKPFTAVIIMQLVTEGRLKLSDPVSNWYPDLPNAREMTIEHLLRHTNGLVSFNALPDFGSDYRTPDQAIAAAVEQGPQFSPGEAWAYTNTGYAILGRIIEMIDGQSLHEVIDRRIAKPLALSHTVLRHPSDAVSAVDGHSSGARAPVGDGYATAFAAGGIASTAEDIVRFWHALLAGRLVADDHLNAMFSRLAPMEPSGRMFYGMGVQLYDVAPGPGLMLGHSGGITGFTGVVAYLPEDQLYVAVLFNDKDVSAEAGLWLLVRTIREHRAAAN